MLRAVLLTSTLSLSACMGYSDTASEPNEPISARTPAPIEPPPQDDAGTAALPPPDASAASAEDGSLAAVEADAPVIDTESFNLRLGHSARFSDYLTDEDGQSLYMFAEDVAGSGESACIGACAKDWPPFDLEEAKPEPGILINEVTRIHRQDGRFQSVYKGHPLYYRASEAGTRAVTADAVDGRWFVARDYLAFISVSMSFAPAGSGTFDAGFLTNGFGRALYVCFDDTPADGSRVAVSSCTGECARRRPIWSVSEKERTAVLPSVMDPNDLTELTRPDGAVQLLLRGWPVYYFSGDERWGDTQGQNQDAWRAIDPVNFGRQVATQLAWRTVP
jgi:predicted lipoprotein with Yx(FWY)xxD motif